MQNHNEKHPKQDFQVERLAFFSDAVFAIAITLLIIEFKVPEVAKNSTFESVWDQIVALKYQFFSLLLSFALIAVYWMRHHFLFKHLHNYNKAVVIANMFVLMPVIFFPFTTAFLAESADNKEVVIFAVRLFLINHILAGLTTYFFYWIALIRHKEFAFDMTAEERRTLISQTLFPSIVYVITLLSTFLKSSNIESVSLTIIGCFFLKKLFDKFSKKRFQGNA